MPTHVVKRKTGHQELYDERKVYASCYAACLNASLPKEEAEALCDTVTKEVNAWIVGKDIVSSQEIFEQTTRSIEKLHKGAGFMYKTHRDIS